MLRKTTNQITRNYNRLRHLRYANVHSLGPLANAFDKPGLNVEHPDEYGVGLFGIAELTKSDGFYELKEQVLSNAKHLVSEAVSRSPSQGVVAIFDNLSNELCKVADLAEFTRLTHPDVDFTGAAEQTSFEIGSYVEKLNTNFSLYKALDDSLKANKDNMDSITRKVAELLLFDFEQSGIHLDKNRKEIAVGLHEAVIVLGARFAESSQMARRVPIGTWPTNVSIPYKIDGDHLLADATYCDSDNERVRELCHKAYFHPCADQQSLLENLFHARFQLASLLGFETFSHRTLKGTTASTHDGLDANVKAWDLRYYTNVVTTQMYNLSASSLREYFSVGCCMEGLNLIFSSLFDVTLNIVQPERGEVWAPLVHKIEVYDSKEGVLGYLYCDFYQRQGKLMQDSHFTIRGTYTLYLNVRRHYLWRVSSFSRVIATQWAKVCRSVFLTIWRCILNAELTRHPLSTIL